MEDHTYMANYRSTDVVAQNIRALLERDESSQNQAAKRGALSQKTISNLARGTVCPRLDTIDEAAAMFRLEPWQLLIGNASDGSFTSPDVAELVRSFVAADKEGREMILALAKREAERNNRKT